MFRRNGMVRDFSAIFFFRVLHFYSNGLKTFILCTKYMNIFINTYWLYFVLLYENKKQYSALRMSLGAL